MDNKNRDDITKSIERAKLTKSYASEKSFDLLDKTAKRLSNLKTDLEDDKKTEEETNNKEQESQEQKNEVVDTPETSKEEYESRLKTSENSPEKTINENETQENTTSRLKTNVNKEDVIGEGKEETNTPEPKVSKSKLKTCVSNKISNTFGFTENQGKISKTVTVVSKTGKGISKVSGSITRASRDLDKAISSDGTGKDYLKTSVKRKTNKAVKKTINKRIINPIKKPVKKVVNKVTAPIKNKIASAFRLVMKKGIKLLLSAISAISEFILPLALVVLVVVLISSIFSWGSKTTNSYQNYMTTMQQSFDKEVNEFMRENPDCLVVGVRGSYGKIDWRVPLSIMQGTGADLSLDATEKELFEKFKSAGLLEKHEIIEQTTTTGEGENQTTSTTKIMVITNPGYDEYMEWINNNFSYMNSFMQKKKVTDYSSTGFNTLQLELIKSLYESDNLFDEFDKKFVDYPIRYGSNVNSMNLSSDYYNSKNTLTTSGFKGQCTWFSFGRALENTGIKMPTGNAQTWLSSAVAMGYKTGSRPAPNSVAVLAGRKFGHVAYVEAYDGTSITISEGNVGNKCSVDSSDCSQVEYAKKHANELVRTKTYSSLKAYKEASKSSGLYLVGFIYTD